MGSEDKLVRKKLEIALQDPALVEAYLRKHGPKLDAQKIEAFKKEAHKSGVAGHGGPEEPTFQILVKCPACGQRDIIAREMRAKTFTVTQDRFMMPRYEPMKGYAALNYSLAAVTVCPQCLFASPDKKDFITHSVQTNSEIRSQLGPLFLEAFKKRHGERQAMLSGVSDYAAYFKHPRAPLVAIASYRLAMLRAKIEAEFEIALGGYKAGMYGLRIALLLRDMRQSDETITTESVKYLKISYARNEMPSADLECQLLYTIVAIYMRLQQFTEARSYLGVLEKMKTLPTEPGPDESATRPASLERWLGMAEDLWTNREDTTLWKH